MGIAGRVYFSDTARLDPWLELGLGLARDLRYVDGPAFASTLSAGVDLFATRRLRVGPWLAIRSSLARRNYCDAVDPAFCRSHSGVRYGLEGLAAGLSVTALLGSPL
jgi:hypothetical protein